MPLVGTYEVVKQFLKLRKCAKSKDSLHRLLREKKLLLYFHHSFGDVGYAKYPFYIQLSKTFYNEHHNCPVQNWFFHFLIVFFS